MPVIGKYYGVASCFYANRLNFCVLRTGKIGQEVKDKSLSWNEYFGSATIDRLTDSITEVMRLQTKENNKAGVYDYVMPLVTGWTLGYQHPLFDLFTQECPWYEYSDGIPVPVMNLIYYLKQKIKSNPDINTTFSVGSAEYFPGRQYEEHEINQEEIKRLEDLLKRAKAGDKEALAILCVEACKEAVSYCETARQRFGPASSATRFVNMDHPKDIYFNFPPVKVQMAGTIRAQLGLKCFRIKFPNEPRSDYFFDIVAPLMDEAIVGQG